MRGRMSRRPYALVQRRRTRPSIYEEALRRVSSTSVRGAIHGETRRAVHSSRQSSSDPPVCGGTLCDRVRVPPQQTSSSSGRQRRWRRHLMLEWLLRRRPRRSSRMRGRTAVHWSRCGQCRRRECRAVGCIMPTRRRRPPSREGTRRPTRGRRARADFVRLRYWCFCCTALMCIESSTF